MKPLFRLWLALALGASAVAAAPSCTAKKEETPVPAPAATGGLKGVISPAGSVSEVVIKSAAFATYRATPDATTGAFTVNDITPGEYTLAYTAAPSYLAPATQAVVIKASEVKDVGTLSMALPGIISGTISPANGVVRVEITSQAGKSVTVVPNATTGAFSASEWPLGSSVVHFVMATGFLSESDRTISLTAASPTYAFPTLNLHSGGPVHGTVTWTLDGTTYSVPTATGNIFWDGSKLNMSLEASSVAGSTTDKVSVNAIGISGVGNYRLGIGGGPQGNPYGYITSASYSRRLNAQTVFVFGTTSLEIPTAAGGALTVQRFDANARTLAGTFNFDGDRTASGPVRTANVTQGVTNGTFDLQY